MRLRLYRHNTDKYARGDYVTARASSSPFDGALPQSFVELEIAEPMRVLRQYANKPWETNIQHEIVRSNSAQDAFRIRLYSDTAKGTLGAVARDKIEMFINNWGGTVFSFAENEVVFDISIYNAITSSNFWERVVSQIVFTELSYTQSGGVHRVQGDYSALPINPTSVEDLAEQQGATIISHANRVLVFDVTRATVRDRFIQDIQSRGRERIARFRYRVSDAMVTAAENAGGVLQTALAEVQANLIDKVTE